MKLKSRWCESLLKSALRALPVVVVTGARQTGKTTLVRNMRGLGKRRFFTLDQIDILEQAERDPESLLAELPVTIDEIQRAPKLLFAIKRKVDEFRQSGAILLTGSANLALFEKVNESLAGRAYYLELPPFCPAEWLNLPPSTLGLDALFDVKFDVSKWRGGAGDWRAWTSRGGYPPAVALDDTGARDLWFAGYVQTYLERDLRQLSNVSSLADFQRVMRLSAQRVSRLVNQSDLSRESGVPQPTVHRYLNLLETGYQVARLTNYQRNPNKSLTKARKLQWTDAGVAAWLCGGVEVSRLSERSDVGFWLEQVIFQSLHSWRSLEPRRRVHYWREGGSEVDFVLEQNGRILGIEVKAGAQVSTDDLKGLRAFQKAFTRKETPRGIVLHSGKEARFLGNNAYALPLGPFAPSPSGADAFIS